MFIARCFASATEGMTQYDVANLYSRGLREDGIAGKQCAGFGGKMGRATARNNYSDETGEGEVLLIDAGTTVEGYETDITRCTVMGKPPEKIQRAFDTLRKSQDAALDACRAGHLLELLMMRRERL